MPLLFSLGQHPALEAVQRQCPDHTVMAFLDDVYLVSKTQEVRESNPTLAKPTLAKPTFFRS